MSVVEVIGRACRLPGANSVDEFWQLLREGRCSVSRIPEERFAQAWYFNPRRGEPGKSYTFAAGVVEDIWGFDPAVFAITPREARQMDPQQRLVLQLVWEALEDAGIAASSLARRNIGVYFGASSMDHSHRQYFDPAGTDSYLMTGNTLSLISNRVSYQLDLTGPSLTIDTACSSSLVALDYAMQDLNAGKIDAAIVGGVNGLLSPFNFMGFCAASMLSPDGLCRAFDHRANGYVRSEGGVVMVLRRKGDAFAASRIHGEVLAAAMNSDGRTSGVALPSMEQQAALLRSLYEASNIDPARLAFVEAHGTGTQVGDPVECHALGKALGTARKRPLPVGSAKSNVGHLEPASGMVGLLKAQLALEHGVLPATLHVEALNPHIPFDELNLKVATEALPLPAGSPARRLAGVNNFGFGGTNVHVVIGPARQASAKAKSKSRKATSAETTAAARGDDDVIVLLSAQCREGLAAMGKRYARLIDKKASTDSGIAVGAIANAVAHHRDLLPQRLAIAARTAEDLAAVLRDVSLDRLPPQASSGVAVARSAKTAFVFSGNGAQWAGMGRDALETSALFSRHFDAVDRAYEAAAGISLREQIYAVDLAEQLVSTEVAQPLLFAVQVALAKSLIERGIVPESVIGHSVGEVAAAHISGALDLKQAVRVIRARSHHQEIVRGLGGMAALQGSKAAAEDLIRAAKLQNVVVAAINSPRSVTVAGKEDEIRALLALARKQQIAGKLLDIQYPFHSAQLEPARLPILDALQGLRPRSAQIPFVSTVAGKAIDGRELDATYWWRNVREPVRFEEAVGCAVQAGAQVFIEIGPRSILRGYISDCVANADHDTRVVTTFEATEGQAGVNPISGAVVRALAAGARFDRDRMFGPRAAYGFSLPLYPWQNKPFRMVASSEAMGTFSPTHVQHPLLGARVRSDSLEWERQLDAVVLPFLADHKVGDRVIMPGTGYVEMAIAAASHEMGTERVELRDVDFVRAMELSRDAAQQVQTRIESDGATVTIRSRGRLSTDERQTNMHARFARVPSEMLPRVEPLVRQTAPDAPPREDMYRLAARFHLNYGPTFRRMIACREIGDEIIEVELSRAQDEGSEYFLHPVDFDACLHGLNLIYNRLELGENRHSFVPIHIGALRLVRPHKRLACARIKLKRYSARGAVADFELFGGDGELVAIVSDMRFKAATLQHRLKLGQAVYHVGTVVRPLPAEMRRGVVPELDRLVEALDTVAPVLGKAARIAIQENILLLELAAQRVLNDTERRAERDALAASSDTHCLPGFNEEQSAAFGAYGDAAEVMSAPPLPGASGPEVRAPAHGESAPASDENEVIEAEEALPPVEAIVESLLADAPSWSAECIMLLNAARCAEKPATGPEHTSATLEHFQAGTPRSSAEIAAVVQVVGAALMLVPRTRSFRILQLGSFGSGLTRELLPLLANGNVQIVVSDPDARQLGRLASQWPNVPGLMFQAIGEDLAELQGSRFDLVVSVNGLSQMRTRHNVLSRLPGVLADRAMAVICEREPDLFHRVVFTASQSISEGQDGVLALQGAEAWREELRAAGFEDVRAADEAHSVPGSVLLLAETPARTTDDPDLPTSIDGTRAEETAPTRPRSVIVVGQHKQGAGFEARLERTLAGLGLPVLHHTTQSRTLPAGNGKARPGSGTEDGVTDGDDWSALVARIDSTISDDHDIVLSLDAATADAKAEMSALLLRLTALSELLKALGERGARFWIVAEGGARAAAGLGSACPVQTGIWSFGRTAINEFGKLDLRLVDFAEGMKPAEKAVQLARLISTPGDVRELILDGESLVALEARRGVRDESVRDDLGGVETSGTRSGDAAVLVQREWGNLDELFWVRGQRRVPDQDEVEIEVAASGLNFRDVMWSMGLLPEEALENGFAGPTIGLECAGRIVRVGSDVTDFAVGDPVIAIAPASFASHVTVAARAAGRLPSHVGLREAASIPVAFLTACYSLERLARLRKGEWVLVHGAAGGVGLAALQVAKRNGARVIATAGSNEKRNFLRRLGADVVLDTRSLDFVDQVRQLTGDGVHVVLNSLAGEAMERSIELLRPFGRFIELGKRDFYASTMVNLRPFRNNVSYFGVDADQLLTFEPEVAKEVLEDVMNGFEAGDFSPLPCRIFKSGELLDAFRLMQKSGHIGKIIVEAPAVEEAGSAKDAEFRVSADGYHVVFGGTGGFGLAYAHWLVDRGARHVVVASRSGGASDELRKLASALEARGVSLVSEACDVTDRDAVKGLLAKLRKERPIAGITHTAMILDDGLITALTPDRFARVLAPKVVGARILDELTRKDALDYFIMFSSAAAMFGNPGQGSYVAANGYLDGLARERQARGLKALSVAWGAITDVGILARDKNTAKSLSRHTGGVDFTARTALDLLAQVLADERHGQVANISLAAMNWGMARSFLPIMGTPAYDLIRREADARGDASSGGTDLQALVLSLDEADAKKAVADYLAREVAAIFRMPAEDINPKRSLTEIGMDSLMGLELRMAVERQIGIDIMKVSMSGGTTINDIADHIATRLRGARDEADAATSAPMLMLSQHVTEEIDVEDIRRFESHVATREADLGDAVR